MNYYEHHLGDYAKDAGHLSLIEEGAYRRLLDAYYTREKPLPADLRECCKLARAVSKAERDAVAYVLAEFFKHDPDGGHRQARADAEIARFQDKQRKAKASAEARWSQSERNANASADAMRTHSERSADGMHRAPVPSPQSPDTRREKTSNLAVAPALPPEDRPQLTLVEGQKPKPKDPPDCPHQDVLALWAEVLPAMPQHSAKLWRGSRADHLRTRWRETAIDEGWSTQAEGLTYLRRLFAYVAKSPFLTGRIKPRDGKPPFLVELEWLVLPTNWAKVIEGKYHQESA